MQNLLNQNLVNKLLEKLDCLNLVNDHPVILFITGASGAGKTYLIEKMEKVIPHNQLGYFKFDTIGVPSFEEMISKFGSGEKWQENATHRWVKHFASDKSLPQVVIFEGQYNLDFAIEACKKFGVENYRIVLATVPDEVMTERLIRIRNQPELVNENMFNWSKFLRTQGEAKGALILDTSAISTEEAINHLLEELLELISRPLKSVIKTP